VNKKTNERTQTRTGAQPVKPTRTHQELDRRSLELHRLVADKVRRDPALLDRAAAILSRWRGMGPSHADAYLAEWARLIAVGMDECLAVAVEDSERAAALRQNSPLSCLLSTRERNEFLRNWREGIETNGFEPMPEKEKPALPSNYFLAAAPPGAIVVDEDMLHRNVEDLFGQGLGLD